MQIETTMRRSTVSTAVMLFTLSGATILCAQKQPMNLELNTLLFHSTFKIEQKLDQTRAKVGTVFILGRPYPNDPTKAWFVLVTAKHVLAEMPRDEAQLILRQKLPNSTWKRLPLALKIRKAGEPLWKEHPSADVAVMYVPLPPDTGVDLLPTTMLADDKVLEQFEIHPGDELNCLGYPFGGEANGAGFPILRSGKIASYPLYPAKDYPTFFYDFEVFGGNSGGPVYMVESNRNYAGATHVGKIQFIAGLVSQQASYINERLALAVVVHANLIRGTIDLLPIPDEVQKK